MVFGETFFLSLFVGGGVTGDGETGGGETGDDENSSGETGSDENGGSYQ